MDLKYYLRIPLGIKVHDGEVRHDRVASHTPSHQNEMLL